MRDTFVIDPGWAVVLRDRGVSVTNVLKRAGEPEDLLFGAPVTLATKRFFALWTALEEEAGDPLLALHLGEVMTAESFQAPAFAALCSDNLLGAAQRLSDYEGLIGPLRLEVVQRPGRLEVAVDCLHRSVEPVPVNLLLWKLVFLTRLARMGTRENVHALQVTSPELPGAVREYSDFFGAKITREARATVTYSAADASRPFLSRNEALWSVFEPALRLRLSELRSGASTRERVRAALLELLPSGRGSLDDVGQRLAVGRRTLQRRLRDENVAFQDLLDEVRSELAQHYLKREHVSYAEISFLLGFADPNSFFRAFRDWTGTTPEAARRALLAAS